MKKLNRINKKTALIVIIMIFFIAGILDLKYEGLFYQLLPKSVQSIFDNLL
ncbi:hypothetical protein RZN22_08555 [Bacillaceae bacterium S4-13-58]